MASLTHFLNEPPNWRRAEVFYRYVSSLCHCACLAFQIDHNRSLASTYITILSRLLTTTCCGIRQDYGRAAKLRFPALDEVGMLHPGLPGLSGGSGTAT